MFELHHGRSCFIDLPEPTGQGFPNVLVQGGAALIKFLKSLSRRPLKCQLEMLRLQIVCVPLVNPRDAREVVAKTGPRRAAIIRPHSLWRIHDHNWYR